MKEIDFKTYNLLKVQKEIAVSKIPKSVLNSNIFQSLLSSNILLKYKKGKGFIVSINEDKENKFDVFFDRSFPEDSFSKSKSSNIKKYRDSKASQIKNEPIFLIRGFKNALINNEELDIKYYTKTFGLFVIKNPVINTDKVCFVENLDTFLKAEMVLGNDYIYFHKYGRIGKDSISNIDANEYVVFVDYDFNGLDEYLRIKSIYPNSNLFVPENFDELYKKFSKTLKGNKAKMTIRVKNSQLPEVVKIRELVLKNNKFLEQEILTDD